MVGRAPLDEDEKGGGTVDALSAGPSKGESTKTEGSVLAGCYLLSSYMWIMGWRGVRDCWYEGGSRGRLIVVNGGKGAVCVVCVKR